MISSIDELDDWIAKTVIDIGSSSLHNSSAIALKMMFYAGMKFQLEKSTADREESLNNMLNNMVKAYDRI